MENAPIEASSNENPMDVVDSSDGVLTLSEREKCQALFLPRMAYTILNNRKKETRKEFFKWAERFDCWWVEKKNQWEHDPSDQVLMIYIESLKDRYQPSTLWPILSYTKDYLFFRYNMNKRYLPLTTEFIKNLNEGYQPNQALFLPFEEYENFWEKAPNDSKFLLLKVKINLYKELISTINKIILTKGNFINGNIHLRLLL